MVELYWSEIDIAWNGYTDFSVVCLHWVALTSDKDQREFSLSRSLQYNSALKKNNRTLKGHLHWRDFFTKTNIFLRIGNYFVASAFTPM